MDIAPFARTLHVSGLTALGHLVDLPAPNLQNAEGVAAHLGLRPVRVVAQLLRNWNALRSREGKEMLEE